MNLFKTITDWLQSLISDSNGVADDGRISALSMVFTYIGLAIFNTVILKHPFDCASFGTGAAALATGIGAWFRLRGDK